MIEIYLIIPPTLLAHVNPSLENKMILWTQPIDLARRAPLFSL